MNGRLQLVIETKEMAAYIVTTDIIIIEVTLLRLTNLRIIL